jgi:hypothetical protein
MVRGVAVIALGGLVRIESRRGRREVGMDDGGFEQLEP